MEGADVDQAAAQSPATKRSGRERLRVLTRERAVGPWLPPDAVQASDGRIQTERPAQPLVQGKRSARLARRDPRTSNRGTQRVCEQASRPVCVMRVEPCSPETHKDAEAPFRQASLRTGLPRGRGMHSATQTSCRSGTGATEKLGPVVSGKTPGSEEAGRLEQEEGWGPEFHPGQTRSRTPGSTSNYE